MAPSLEDNSLKEEEGITHPSDLGGRRGSKDKIKWLLAALAALVVIGLAVGLGVGLTVGRNGGNNDDNESSDQSSENGSTSTTVTPGGLPANFTNSSTTSYWTPAPGLTWNYLLLDPINSTETDNTSVWGIDLFNNNASIVQGLQGNGAKVICYFSAGSYEDWRPDADQFQPADLGSDLKGWRGEKWLNVSSPNVHNIMLARMDMAVQKHCDGIDPDNVDGYANKNGLGLVKQDSIDYMEFLANEAHSRGLAIGLKNAGDILPDVINGMQWSINEQCTQYQECSTFAPFIEQGKPVFHVEYPKGDDTNNDDNVDAATMSKYCNDSSAAGFSTILKNIDLDPWIEIC